MQSTDTVQDGIFDAIAELGPDRSEITREATFEQLDIDSLDLAELSQIVEDEYGVKFTSNDVENLKTVGDAIDFIVAKS